MRHVKFPEKLHIRRLAAVLLTVALLMTGVPVQAAAPSQDTTGSEGQQTTETASSTENGGTENALPSTGQELTPEQKEEAYSKSLKRSKYGKLYYDYVAEGNVIPATTLFVGTYLMDARAINASGAEQVAAVEAEGAEKAEGKETYQKRISNVIYQKALQSQITYNQKVRYYRSELADAQWRDISAAGDIKDIMASARVVPKSELDPLIITCVVGSDGIPRDPDGNEMNIFDYPNPYEMDEITELKPVQDYFNSGKVTEQSSGSDNYRYWRLYFFFQHDNMVFDRDATTQAMVDNGFDKLTEGDSGKKLETAWDEAEVKKQIPDDEYKDFKQTVRNWPNVRDSVTNLADRGLDTTYKLSLSLKKKNMEEEGEEALKLAEALDAERRAEVFFNLTKNQNILLTSRLREMERQIEDTDAEILALQAQIEELNTVTLPDLVRRHAEIENELSKTMESAEKAQAEAAEQAEEAATEETAADETAVEEAATEETAADEAGEESDLTRLEELYQRQARYTSVREDLAKKLAALRANNPLADLGADAVTQLETIYTLRHGTIPDLQKKIPYGESQVSRQNTERQELEQLEQDALDQEKRTLAERIRSRITDNETMTKTYQDAVNEAKTQLSEAETLLEESGSKLQTALQQMDAAENPDNQEKQLLSNIHTLSDQLESMPDDASEEAWNEWNTSFSKAKAEALAVKEQKDGAITAKEDEIKTVDRGLATVKEAIESRESALQAELSANEKEQAAVKEQVGFLQDQIRYKQQAAEARQKQKLAYESGNKLASEKQQKAAEVAELKADQAKMSREKSAIEGEKPALESALQAALADMDSVKAKTAEIENEMAALNAELAELTSGKEAMENRQTEIYEEIRSIRLEKQTHLNDTLEKDPAYQNLLKQKESLEQEIKDQQTQGMRDACVADFFAWEEEEINLEKAYLEAEKEALLAESDEAADAADARERANAAKAAVTDHQTQVTGSASRLYQGIFPYLESAAKAAADYEKAKGTNGEKRAKDASDASEAEVARQQKNFRSSTERKIRMDQVALAEKGPKQLEKEEELTLLNESLEQTNASIETERARIEQEDADWQTLQDQRIATLRQERESLKDRITQNGTDAAEKQREVDEKQAEIDANQPSVDAEQNKVKEAQEKVDKKQTEIDTRQASIDALQEEITEKQREYEAIDAADFDPNAMTAEFSIGPTVKFLRLLSETGGSDQGRVYSKMEAYGGTEYDEDVSLTNAVDESILNCDASYATYIGKSITRGEEVYENFRYQYSRRVIDAGLDENLAIPLLQTLVDLDNVYYNEDVVHQERELRLIDETLLPACLGRLEAVKEQSDGLSAMELDRDVEEYQSYIMARTDRDTVNQSIVFVERRITYAQNLKGSAKDWAKARIEEHIEWLRLLLASLNSRLDDSDMDFRNLDEEIQKLIEEERKALEEDDQVKAKKIGTIRQEKEAEKNEIVDEAIDPNLSGPEQLDKLNRIGGKPKVEDDLRNKILDEIEKDDYEINNDLDKLAAIGGDIGPILEGLNNKGAPEDIINKAKEADANSRKSPLYGYNQTPPVPSGTERGSGDNSDTGTGGGTDTGGAGGTGGSNTGGGSAGARSGVGVDRGSLSGNQIGDIIEDVFGDDVSDLSDDELAAILAALAKYGKEYGDDPLLAYAMSLLEQLLGKGNVNGFIYRQYQQDPDTEYVSFGSVDMTRAYSFYRYTHQDQRAVLSQILGGSASYSFTVGADTATDSQGKERELKKPAVSQADSYLHGNTDTLYPYITREDSEALTGISCVYMPGKDWAILVPPSLKQKMAELTEKLNEAAVALKNIS